MKKIVFISAILSSWIGCNQTDIPSKYDVTDKNYKGIEVPKYSDKHNPIRKNKEDIDSYDYINGYEIDECVYGCKYSRNRFHKLLFHNGKSNFGKNLGRKDGKSVVSKFAYSSEEIKSSATPLSPCFTFVTIYAWTQSDIWKLWNCTRDFDGMIDHYNLFPFVIFRAYKMVYNSSVVDMLTKEQYDKYILEHPDTEILDY